MADIVVDKVHNLGAAEALSRFMFVQEQLERKYKVHVVWTGYRAVIQGPGLRGNAWIDEVRLGVTLDLAFFLRPLAGKLARMIEAAMDETIEGKLSYI